MLNIHQPHLAPWLPYYARIAAADTVVMLDDVQFRRYYYQNRFVLLDSGGTRHLVTIPVSASTQTSLRDVRLFAPNRLCKILKTIRQLYGRSPHLLGCLDALEGAFHPPPHWLIDLNTRVLRQTYDLLGLSMPPMHLASSLTTAKDATVRIIEISRQLGDGAVIAGWGASLIVHRVDDLAANGIVFSTVSRDAYVRSGFNPDQFAGVSIIGNILLNGPAKTAQLISSLAGLYCDQEEILR